MGLRREESLRVEAKHRAARLLIIAAGCLCLGLALIAGGMVTKVLAVIIVIAMLQGMWFGAIKIGGIVAGMLVGVLVGPVLGRMTEGAVGSITGSSGLINRMVSIALGILVVLIVVTVGCSLFAKKYLSKRELFTHWDRIVGAGVGLGEGILLALVVVWIPMALEPIAKFQIRSRELALPGETIAAPNHVAQGIVAFASKVKESAVGRTAAGINPMMSVSALTLAADFAAIARHEPALQHFVRTAAIQEAKDLASVRQSIHIAESDPEFIRMIRDDELSLATINAILRSDTVLRMFDETTVLQDIRARAPQLAQAISEARKLIPPEADQTSSAR